MKAFHVVCGLPRSGSTLLCNILAQNKAFHVRHTSEVVMKLRSSMAAGTESAEVKGSFAHDPRDTDETSWREGRSIVESYHDPKKVNFDKSRGWNDMQFVLEKLYPEARIICCVRDLRAVFGSQERNWRRNPMFMIPPGLIGRQRMNNQFSPDGMIGGPLTAIEDLLLYENPRVLFVRYENLTDKPKLMMQQIYQHIGEPYFEHDFKDIKNTATDPDWLYLGKFPHYGNGEVKDRTDWQQFVPRQFADEIMQPRYEMGARHHWYNQAFGYMGE